MPPLLTGTELPGLVVTCTSAEQRFIPGNMPVINRREKTTHLILCPLQCQGKTILWLHRIINLQRKTSLPADINSTITAWQQSKS